ncbi:MAG: phosphoribosyl-AMP cyclohydrolase [Pseudomonadota bacterium]
MSLLKQLENAPLGQRVALSQVLDALPYNEDGLVAAIAQDAQSQDVLMLAWMDRKAIEITLSEGYVCYYSRSRQTYWRKGETSGHQQQLIEMRFDCDGDALLLKVIQTGQACHTNRPNCFYLLVDGNEVSVDSAPQ